MPVHPEAFEPGTPCWADVLVDDHDAARRFYGHLFGWTFEDLPAEAGGYVMASKDGHVVAAAMAAPSSCVLATDESDSAWTRRASPGTALSTPP